MKKIRIDGTGGCKLSMKASSYYRVNTPDGRVCLATPEGREGMVLCEDGDCRTCLFPISATMMQERWKQEEMRPTGNVCAICGYELSHRSRK